MPSRYSTRADSASLILRGVSLSYIGVMIVLPIAILTLQSFSVGPQALIAAVANPFAWHALKLTFVTALIMTAINALMGTLTAWVLVRYPFPFKGIVNALVDLPFAIPTVVTGLMLVALYGADSVLGAIMGGKIIYEQPAIVLALLFVSYPFVIRSVQPVLIEMDSAEEEAARTLGAGSWLTFRRVILPTLWPAIWSGSGQAFSRALGEFGSVLMVSGNRPMETTTAATYVYSEIEGGRQASAVAVSLALLACSLGLLLLVNALQRRGESANAA